MEKKSKPRVNINIESLFVGDEPTWGDPKQEISLMRSLSWYSNQKDWKDSKKYTLDYTKKNGYSKDIIEKLSEASEDLYKNLGFVCRMIMRGADLDRKEWIDSRIKEIVNYNPNDSVVSSLAPTKVDSRSIQDRVFDQASVYISEIEGYVDEFIKARSSEFKCYDWLVSNSIKPIYLKQIQDHYVPMVNEVRSAYNKEDEQLVESYSHWSKKELSSFVSFIDSIIKDCEKYSSNTKTVRKVTKKKTVSVDKKVAKLQYKKEDTESKLVSINPADIIAATQLWVYNTKSKKLSAYYSKDDAGLSVKGTTLENVDENLSMSKTLRKPLDILPLVLKTKKPQLKNIMKEIKTTNSNPSPRINQDTILLRVIK